MLDGFLQLGHTISKQQDEVNHVWIIYLLSGTDFLPQATEKSYRGAQDLQILLQGANSMDSRKNELYAGLLE